MNTLIKKEIRLLLPAWIAAMVLAVVPTFFVLSMWRIEPPELSSGLLPQPHFQMLVSFVPLIFALGVLLLGISSFGQELNSGCFGILLSQPAERRRIWFVKVSTLAIAFISVLLTAVFLVSCLCAVWKWSMYDPDHPFRSRYALATLASFRSQTLEYLTLSALVTFSGGLWTTLLLRQTTGAFWFTLLTPLAIIMGLSIVLPDWVTEDQEISCCIVIALILYSIVGFFLAWKLFLRAQDIQWGGGEISLPWRGKISGAKIIPVSIRPRHWLAALAWKEIQLHQASLVIAGVLLVLHLACVVTHKIHPHFEGPDLQFVFETFWILWLLMPLLIGTTAIAEERRIGILESQLCAPVSRRAQLFIKFFIALALSLFLGGVIPLLVEGTHVVNFWIFAVAAAIFLVSFYASSLARTTLQAIGWAIVLDVIIFPQVVAALNALDSYNFSYIPGGLELLKLYLGPPILLLALGWLTLWNFKWLHPNRKLWWRNVIVVLAAFASIFILTNAVYFRAWELLMPPESRGPARLDSSAQVKFALNFDTLYATLPDGRLWTETLDFQNISNRWGQSMIVVPDRCRAQFLSGSNWVQVAADNFQALGIQSDGTLWSLQRSWNPARRHLFQRGPFNVTRLGSSTDWSQVAGGYMGFLALKKDGSLWVWGNHDFNPRYRPNTIPQKLKSDLAAPPARVGVETNWTGLVSSQVLSACAKKNDGSWWTWREGTNQVPAMMLETNLNDQWSNWTFWGDSSFVGVKTNGELWYYFTVGYSSGGKHGPIQRQVLLGRDAKWKTATIYGDAILAMRNDDTLWSWSPRWALMNDHNLIKPVQLGTHSDWIALTGNWMAGLALAPDGNLYAWDQPSRHAWLAPSRRPVYVGNIFEGTGGKE